MTRVFKVVWVDSRGRKWSAMKGVKRFFTKNNPYGKAPLTYAQSKLTYARTNDKPYLFAFASVASAVKWLTNEFFVQNVTPADGVIRLSPRESKAPKGHLEVWEAVGDESVLPGPEALLGVITPQFYDAYVKEGAPYGTVFCRSIRLVSKVTNLL